MASITIRNLDDDVKTQSACAGGGQWSLHGRGSAPDPARCRRAQSSRNLTTIIRSHFGPANGVGLELPSREPGREPPSFD